MKEAFTSHTDFGVLASRLKRDALASGHDPSFHPNGLGYAMTCTDCGSQTHIEPHGDPRGGSVEWHAMASPAHRLNFNSCAAPPIGGTLTERLGRAQR